MQNTSLLDCTIGLVIYIIILGWILGGIVKKKYLKVHNSIRNNDGE